MSFEIRRVAGSASQVDEFVRDFEPSNDGGRLLWNGIREGVRLVCQRLNAETTVELEANGYIASDGSAELRLSLRTIRKPVLLQGRQP